MTTPARMGYFEHRLANNNEVQQAVQQRNSKKATDEGSEGR
jgi:hypothetical protein